MGPDGQDLVLWLLVSFCSAFQQPISSQAKQDHCSRTSWDYWFTHASNDLEPKSLQRNPDAAEHSNRVTPSPPFDLGTFENRKAEHCAPLQSIQNLEHMKLYMMESSHNRASIGRNSKIRINLYTENCAVESRGHLTLPGNYPKKKRV